MSEGKKVRQRLKERQDEKKWPHKKEGEKNGQERKKKTQMRNKES